MICSSCGANSDNEDKCDYCGSKITRIDTSEILIEKDSRKAGILELNDQLSYIYSDKNNTDQVVSRLIDSSKEFIDSGDLKRAEFLLQLASGHDNNNDEVIIVNGLTEKDIVYLNKPDGYKDVKITTLN